MLDLVSVTYYEASAAIRYAFGRETSKREFIVVDLKLEYDFLFASDDEGSMGI